MKKFRVTAKVSSYCHIDIMANSREEAMQIADRKGGEEFYSDDTLGTFDIVSAKAIRMTKQQKVKAAIKEFAQLKDKLFGINKFVCFDETSNDAKRYNQLLQYFNPELRSADYVSPI